MFIENNRIQGLKPSGVTSKFIENSISLRWSFISNVKYLAINILLLWSLTKFNKYLFDESGIKSYHSITIK